MTIKNRLKSLLQTGGPALLLAWLFSGCVAAVPLMLTAQAASLGMGALAVTRSVQLSTGGSLEVAIGENEIPGQNKMVLADISRLSIWPGHEAQVFLADNLQKSKAFDLIVTPSKVGRAIREALARSGAFFESGLASGKVGTRDLKFLLFRLEKMSGEPDPGKESDRGKLGRVAELRNLVNRFVSWGYNKELIILLALTGDLKEESFQRRGERRFARLRKGQHSSWPGHGRKN